MLMSRVICQTNWNTSFYVVFQSIISQATDINTRVGYTTVKCTLVDCRYKDYDSHGNPAIFMFVNAFFVGQ